MDWVFREKGIGTDFVLKSPTRITVIRSVKFKFRVTNNQLKYEMLLVGLRFIQGLGAKNITVHSYLQLMVNQINGDY